MSPTSNAASKSTETELQRKDMNNETAYDQCNNSQDDNQIVDTAELQCNFVLFIIFNVYDGGFPFSTCPMSNPPENLQNPEDKSWLDQYIIDKVLRDNKLNNEWLYNNLWNELYSLFLQTRNLDVSNKLLKDFVMTMYTSLNAMQIRDSLADHLRGRPKGSKKKTGNNTILNKSKSRANKRQVSINKITPPRNKTSSVARKNKNLDEDEDYSQENEENINEEELLKNLSDMNYEEDHNSEDSLEIASLERGSEVRSRHEAIPPSQTPGRSLENKSRLWNEESKCLFL
ncbi:hypothetical protein RhiirB3_471955 [Rhizophagus irregularis]|nr:hypothetical protein RhiirB3_471955 [Rhizophagus irregularis]